MNHPINFLYDHHAGAIALALSLSLSLSSFSLSLSLRSLSFSHVSSQIPHPSLLFFQLISLSPSKENQSRLIILEFIRLAFFPVIALVQLLLSLSLSPYFPTCSQLYLSILALPAPHANLPNQTTTGNQPINTDPHILLYISCPRILEFHQNQH